MTELAVIVAYGDYCLVFHPEQQLGDTVLALLPKDARRSGYQILIAIPIHIGLYRRIEPRLQLWFLALQQLAQIGIALLQLAIVSPDCIAAQAQTPRGLLDGHRLLVELYQLFEHMPRNGATCHVDSRGMNPQRSNLRRL